MAPRLTRLLRNCDVAGFGLKRFDPPFLIAEFARARIAFHLTDRSVIDVMQIHHVHEPGNLSAAVWFYLGDDHDGDHVVLADVKATRTLFGSQVAHYKNLPSDTSELHQVLTDVDPARRFQTGKAASFFCVWEVHRTIAKKIAGLNPSYLRGMLDQDFVASVRTLVGKALSRFASCTSPSSSGESSAVPWNSRCRRA